MGFAAFFRAALMAAICSLIFIVPSFAQTPDLQAASQLFVGTWESIRTNVCGPCVLKVDAIENGKALGTLTSNLFGTTPLNGVVTVTKKGKVILSVFTPGGNRVEFDLPKKDQMYATFGDGRDLPFKKRT